MHRNKTLITMKWWHVILLFISFAVCCNTNADCNFKGECQSNRVCYCEWFYEGSNCSDRWQDAEKGWLGMWIFYVSYTSILQFAIMLLILLEVKSLKTIKLNVVNFTLLLLFSASAGKYPLQKNNLLVKSSIYRVYCRWAFVLW
jgi:hypothetical protein